MKNYFLQPGELQFSAEPSEITTVLGSCVAVCIWDKDRCVGGMCHYYLPKKEYSSSSANRINDNPNNFGDIAIVNLLKKFKKTGSERNSLVAKVIGGGHVVEIDSIQQNDIGRLNGEVALNILKSMRIPIVGTSLGDYSSRKVVFNTKNGDLRFQKIKTEYSRKISEAKKIKVLIVDDAKPIRMILRRVIEQDPKLEIFGEAADPYEAKQLMKSGTPDVITLNIKMPKMDGVTFLSHYMATNPIPTIMVSSLNPNESDDVFRALELGAFHYLKKPDFNQVGIFGEELISLIKAASKTKNKIKKAAEKLAAKRNTISLTDNQIENSIILIGASTGGTEAIKQILAYFPRKVPPILIVQHIPAQFSGSFAEALNNLCDFKVSEAIDGEPIKSQHAYVAPGGIHLSVKKKGDQLYTCLSDDPPVNRFKPSVDYLYDSGKGITNKKIVAVLLTGMGNDGANNMLELKKRGAYTVIQNEETCAVYGMPKAAFELNAHNESAPLDKIASIVMQKLSKW